MVYAKAAFEGEAFGKFTKPRHSCSYCLFRYGLVSGVTVKSEDDNFRCPGTVGGEIVNASMDFDTAKALTKAFWMG